MELKCNAIVTTMSQSRHVLREEVQGEEEEEEKEEKKEEEE